MLWKINMLVISALVFAIFAGNLCAQQIVVTEEDDRPGFRNIYLGMTGAEVENAVKEDASIRSPLGFRAPKMKSFVGLAQTTVGPYPVNLIFIFDNRGILYRIVLALPKVTAGEIKTTLQEQVDFFHGVFKKRFGKPTYIRPGKISLSDFKPGLFVPSYSWVKDNVGRYISLRTHGFEYGINITILDKRLAEIKRKEDEERKKREQEGVLDDF